MAGDAFLAQPLTLLGTPLGPPLSAPAATSLLIAGGLAAVDRRWWCRLPAPLPAGALDAMRPAADWPWRAVVVIEVTPSACRIRPQYLRPDERTHSATLPIPAGSWLVLDQPDE